MFKDIVLAHLKGVSINPVDIETRVAYCRFHIPLDYILARQLHKQLAETLYRLNGKQEWEPRLVLKNIVFDDLRFKGRRDHAKARVHGDFADRLCSDPAGLGRLVKRVVGFGCEVNGGSDRESVLGMPRQFMG